MPRKTKAVETITKPQSGSARMAAKGRKPLLLWLTPEEHAKVQEAAAKDSRSMTRYATIQVVSAAEKTLEI